MMYRKSTRQRVLLAALVAASATVVTLDFRQNPGGPIRRIQDGAVAVMAPLQEGVGRVLSPIGDFSDAVREVGRVRSDNARLRTRVEELEAQQREFPELKRENERLLALLQDASWKSGRTLGAKVIGSGPSNHEWTAFIDRGRADGVAESMAVVNSEGLVGRIEMVGEDYSKVLFLVDPRHSVGARLTTSGETGVLSGGGESDMAFDFIDQATPVEVGETVVTSGYDRGIYPAGVPIGRVTRVRVARDGLSKAGLVRPFVDFSRLDHILILMESGPITGGT